jgi:hypothetical protein
MSRHPIRGFLRVGVLSAAALALVILSGGRNSGQRVAAQDQPAAAGPITPNDVFAEIGRRVPEFGGIFVDEERHDTLDIYVLSEGPDLAANLDRAITEVLGPDRPPQRRIELLQGQYSFVQLRDWHDRMSMRVLATPGALLTEIDHTTNRLKVGVETLALEPDVAAVLDELGVPREAVNIEEVPRKELQVLRDNNATPQQALLDGSQADTCLPAPCTLQKKIRRLVGGIEIGASGKGDTCTLGFIADMGINKPKGIVTASHCTNRQGGTINPSPPAPATEKEPSIFFQPTKSDPKNQIGVEALDPCYWDPSVPLLAYPPMNVPSAGDANCMSPPHNPPFPLFCPAGGVCRLSDSAFAAFETVTGGNTTFRLGRIARPTMQDDIRWDPANTYTIVGERPFLMMNDLISKVGRTTGWTTGKVTGVCVNETIGSPYTIICDDTADYLARGGDSGAPIFECLDNSKPPMPVACDAANATTNVRAVGVHFAGKSTPPEDDSFSPIGSINMVNVTGVQNEAHELGGFFKCDLGPC